MKTGEGQLHLGLDARHPKNPASRACFDQILQQRCLADSGLPAQDQGRTLPSSGAPQKVVQGFAFICPSEEDFRRPADTHHVSRVDATRDARPQPDPSGAWTKRGCARDLAILRPYLPTDTGAGVASRQEAEV